MKHQSTTRFSKTIDYYDRYRPGYPKSIIQFLQKTLQLSPDAVIADIGSGTGKLTRLFLENDNKVYAVEPNEAMRGFAKQVFDEAPNLISTDGTAENTTLPNQSVDIVIAAQAFHWFDYLAFKRESQRILKPGGWVLLLWNKRIDEKSAFMEAYNDFLNTYATDYQKVNLRYVDHEIFKIFYGHDAYQLFTTEHFQTFDQSGLEGRYLSSSYAYHADHPEHRLAMNALKAIFEHFEKEGVVNMWYRSELYYGQLK